MSAWDVREMPGRCQGDAREMPGRCQGDAREMLGDYVATCMVVESFKLSRHRIALEIWRLAALLVFMRHSLSGYVIPMVD
jgi:hypothetical protein